MDRCIEFAQIFGEDIEKARLIGIAHDIVKEVSKEKRVASNSFLITNHNFFSFAHKASAPDQVHSAP